MQTDHTAYLRQLGRIWREAPAAFQDLTHQLAEDELQTVAAEVQVETLRKRGKLVPLAAIITDLTRNPEG